MKPLTPSLPLTLPLLAALLGACATTGGGSGTAPAPAVAAAPRDCQQIEAEHSVALAAQREAQERKGTAWKAVVPFAVAGRVVGANQTIRDTEQRLAALNEQARRLGCRSAL